MSSRSIRLPVVHSLPALRRFLFLIVASILIASASGAVAMVVPERCGLTETGSEQGNECLPTCPTCGCCSSPIVVSIDAAEEIDLAIEPHTPLVAALLGRLAPQDVFHVPKTSRL